MGTPDPLLDEITILLSCPKGRDDAARLERILTDGYARALRIEAERSQLQSRIGQMAGTADGADESSRRELSALARRLATRDEDLGSLRALLGRLRSRYSAATHVGA